MGAGDQIPGMTYENISVVLGKQTKCIVFADTIFERYGRLKENDTKIARIIAATSQPQIIKVKNMRGNALIKYSKIFMYHLYEGNAQIKCSKIFMYRLSGLCVINLTRGSIFVY